MRAFIKIGIFLMLSLMVGMGVHAPERIAAQEAKIPSLKAFYLYNLLLFVDWPENTFKKGDPLCIAIVGDDLLYQHLQRLSQKTVKGQKLEIRRIQEDEKWPQVCKVVFIGSSKRGLAPALLTRLKKEPVLTVSDMPGFTRMGGMIRIKNLGDPASRTSKRFEINIDRMQQRGLKIRARVLRLADIVYTP